MCINISNNLTKEQIPILTHAKLLDFIEWQPFIQIKATEFFPVITNEFNNVVQYFKWGLVPTWAKNVAMGMNMTKTKKENLLEKTALQAIFRYKRCAIPVTSFSIWRNKEKKEYQEIEAPNNSVFWLCGLWDVWGEGLQTFSVLTHKQNSNGETIEVPLGTSFDYMRNWLNKGTVQLNIFEKIPPTVFSI
jgi:putative SOS response-associated peptidase YedK